MLRNRIALLALAVATMAITRAASADITVGLDKKGTVPIQSVGPLAFGPDGVLFVGDTKSASIFAIDSGDRTTKKKAGGYNVEKLGTKIASLLGTTPDRILIHDLAVNPASGKAYLSVSRGRGPDATPVLLSVTPKGEIGTLNLKDVKYAQAKLPNAPAPGGEGRRNRRAQSITDVSFFDGRVFVAGLSNEEFASNLRVLPFPFKTTGRGTSVEIFHGAHGRYETRSPVRTFTHYLIGDAPYLLAAYTCTPLVTIPVAELKNGKKVRGTTIAELGNRNRPLDMFVYHKGNKDYVLIANSARGVMKVSIDEIDEVDGITERISGTAGVTYETVSGLKGVEQLDRLDKGHALLLIKSKDGVLTLKSIALP